MSSLAEAVAKVPAAAPGRCLCGVAHLRAKLTAADRAKLAELIDLVVAEKRTYSKGTAPHSVVWLVRVLAEFGEPVSKGTLEKHIAGRCSCDAV